MSQGDPTAPVAVLFADISGSTLLYAIRGDEEAFRLSSSCLGLVQEELEACGGRIVKRLGDALLAVFGVVSAFMTLIGQTYTAPVLPALLISLAILVYCNTRPVRAAFRV